MHVSSCPPHVPCTHAPVVREPAPMRAVALALLQLRARGAARAWDTPIHRGAVCVQDVSACRKRMGRRRHLTRCEGDARGWRMAHQLVVGCVVLHIQHARLAGDGLRAPREVAGVQAERAELHVATTAAHGAHQRLVAAAQFGIGSRATELIPAKWGLRISDPWPGRLLIGGMLGHGSTRWHHVGEPPWQLPRPRGMPRMHAGFRSPCWTTAQAIRTGLRR
jgi:hypothetical protein